VDAILRVGAAPDQVIVVAMAATTAETTGKKVKADTWGSVDQCQGDEVVRRAAPTLW